MEEKSRKLERMRRFVVAMFVLPMIAVGADAWAANPVSLPFTVGWNLLSSNIGFQVADIFGGGSPFVSVWKFENLTWSVYLPGEEPQGSYATSKGFNQLATINPGEGFWLRSTANSSVAIYGTPVFGGLSLSDGWNLVGLRSDQPTTVAQFVADNSEAISLWKWENGKWSVCLPGEVVDGSYATSKGFGQFDTINPGEGFWVNMPGTSGAATTTTTLVSTTTTTSTSPITTTSKAPTTTTKPPSTTTTTIFTTSTEKWSFTSQDINYATLTFTKAKSGIISVSGPLSYFDSDYYVTVSGSPTGTLSLNSTSATISLSGILQASNGLSAQCSISMIGSFNDGNATITNATIGCPSVEYYNYSSYIIYGKRTSGSGITP
jgi:hypothetical protein